MRVRFFLPILHFDAPWWYVILVIPSAESNLVNVSMLILCELPPIHFEMFARETPDTRCSSLMVMPRVLMIAAMSALMLISGRVIFLLLGVKKH
jgi:hypothetical protein